MYAKTDALWTCCCSFFIIIALLKIIKSWKFFQTFVNIGTVWESGTEEGCMAPSDDRTALVLFSSTMAESRCTWRKTSSSTTVQQRALRPSSTSERCAAAFVFPLENTLLSPPPSSPTRMETFICGCSLRNRLISSMFLPQISTICCDDKK